MRNLVPVFLIALLITSTMTRADEPLVFVSAFASGEKGALHAFEFDGKSGALKPLQRTTGISNPFFLAISPNEKFLYATQAEKFGGKSEESVVAYAIEDRAGHLKK